MYKLHCVYRSRSGPHDILCSQFATTQWDPSGKLHSRLKGGFVRTQRTPLVTGLRWMEWQKSGCGETRHFDRIRRLPDRLGSIFSRFPHGRAMVSLGEESPHKLSRTPCSLSSSEILPKIPHQLARSAKDGQSNSGSICKQYGRDCLRPGNTISERPLDVVPKPGCGVSSLSTPFNVFCTVKLQ